MYVDCWHGCHRCIHHVAVELVGILVECDNINNYDAVGSTAFAKHFLS